ncbi:MAG TPA: glycosyltransferase [Candidatus Acidoferrum sp.]|nr:glycosyltransferase [Candidatus Acidoferrum sp.]
MTKPCVALLGWRDSPTDALEEYCRYLGAALREQDIALEIARVAWAEKGWRAALRELRSNAAKNPDAWFLLQYTALAWSRRGFPGRALDVVRLLKSSGVRVATVFHDVQPYSGRGMLNRLRRRVQLHTLRSAARLSDLSILTIPGERIPWVGRAPARSVYIPVGANLPAPERAWTRRKGQGHTIPTAGVFCITGGQHAISEAKLLADIVSLVAERLGTMRLVVLGRNSEAAESVLREKLRGKAVELVVYGLLSGEDVVNALATCDAMLFLRGPISSRRGSGIAGIACGLPVIAQEGWETAAPITDAGVVLVPAGATHEFGPALLRVLEDQNYRAELAERSRRAQQQHFSWQAIAARYGEALRNPTS